MVCPLHFILLIVADSRRCTIVSTLIYFVRIIQTPILTVDCLVVIEWVKVIEPCGLPMIIYRVVF